MKNLTFDQIYHKLPYRPGVGMMIVNNKRKVFVGRRIDNKIEAWQMPQGGIDLGETPSVAVLREMLEELGCAKGNIIAESKYWYSYDIPKNMACRLWEGNFKGQKQKWFLIKFTGNDEDINIQTLHPEFKAWKWVRLQELQSIIAPFRKRLYKAVLKEFLPLIYNPNNF